MLATGPGPCCLLNVNSIMRPMREVEGTVRLEGDWQPVELCYVARGLRWTVREVLDGWTHPGWPGKTYNKPVTKSGTGYDHIHLLKRLGAGGT